MPPGLVSGWGGGGRDTGVGICAPGLVEICAPGLVSRRLGVGFCALGLVSWGLELGFVPQG